MQLPITHAFFNLRLQFYFLDLQGGLTNHIFFGPGCPNQRSPIDATTAHHYLLGLDHAQSVICQKLNPVGVLHEPCSLPHHRKEV